MANRRRSKEAGWARKVTRICRWCRGPVKPPRRTFCSDECVHEFRIRSDPGYVRECLFEKDKGICAMCGANTEVEQMKMRIKVATVSEETGRPRSLVEQELCKEAGWPLTSRTWWEADHIQAVAEDGGLCGLDNYRTLCVKCHLEETRALRKRLRGQGTKVDRS